MSEMVRNIEFCESQACVTAGAAHVRLVELDHVAVLQLSPLGTPADAVISTETKLRPETVTVPSPDSGVLSGLLYQHRLQGWQRMFATHVMTCRNTWHRASCMASCNMARRIVHGIGHGIGHAIVRAGMMHGMLHGKAWRMLCTSMACARYDMDCKFTADGPAA